MVLVAIYYFAPFRYIRNKVQPNNSRNITELLTQNRFEDITVFELPVAYEAVNPMLQTAPHFDLVLALGEDETLDKGARYEKVSKVNGETVVNPLRTKHIYENRDYDPKNDFVCNYVNHYMIANLPNCLFIHVPVSTANNPTIAEQIQKELVHQKQKITLHTIRAENLPLSQHEVGFEKKYRVHPHIGKLFTSSKKRNTS